MSNTINPKISSTGFRLFILLQLLMQENKTKAEIFDYFEKNYPTLNMSPDILRLDINTLKMAGFEIITGDRSEKYRHSLKWNPLKIHLTKNEWNTANSTRDRYYVYRLMISKAERKLFLLQDPVGLYKSDLIEMVPSDGADITFDPRAVGVFEELLTWKA